MVKVHESRDLHAKGYFRSITKSPDYAGVFIFNCPDLTGSTVLVDNVSS